MSSLSLLVDLSKSKSFPQGIENYTQALCLIFCYCLVQVVDVFLLWLLISQFTLDIYPLDTVHLRVISLWLLSDLVICCYFTVARLKLCV